MPLLPPLLPSAQPDEYGLSDHIAAAQIMAAFDTLVSMGGPRMKRVLTEIGVDPREVLQAINNDRGYVLNPLEYHLSNLEGMLDSWGGPVRVIRSRLDRARRV